jgi:membrane associated rhomboid family serine protease
VGYQCVDCVAEGRQDVRRVGTPARPAPGTRPIVVPALVALNVAVFAWTVLQAGDVMGNTTAALFRQWSLVPGFVHAGEWWRVVTSGFLHIGAFHLLLNMLALWVLGRDLEMVLGRGRFLAVYLVSLLGGAAAVMLFYAPNQQVAGASGAVFGLMGGLAVVLRRLRVPTGQVIGVIVMNVAISFVVPGISLIGHLGGLVVGAAATAALVYAPRRNRTAVQALALVGLTVLVLLVIAATGLR